MEMWLAALIVLGIAVGILIIILLICYGFIAALKIKDRRKR